MKVRLQLPVYTPKTIFFTKDLDLDFLPTEGLCFVLIDIPGWKYSIVAEVAHVQVYINKPFKPSHLIFVSLKELNLSNNFINNKQGLNEFIQAFIEDGWKNGSENST